MPPVAGLYLYALVESLMPLYPCRVMVMLRLSKIREYLGVVR